MRFNYPSWPIDFESGGVHLYINANTQSTDDQTSKISEI